MSNLCNLISTLSNTAEIVEYERPIKLSPLQWSSLTPTLILIPQFVGFSKITKN